MFSTYQVYDQFLGLFDAFGSSVEAGGLEAVQHAERTRVQERQVAQLGFLGVGVVKKELMRQQHLFQMKR
jgi:hypothetical protein